MKRIPCYGHWMSLNEENSLSWSLYVENSLWWSWSEENWLWWSLDAQSLWSRLCCFPSLVNHWKIISKIFCWICFSWLDENSHFINFYMWLEVIKGSKCPAHTSCNVCLILVFLDYIATAPGSSWFSSACVCVGGGGGGENGSGSSQIL